MNKSKTLKTIAFNLKQMSLRGTSVSTYHYADYNEKILGNKSIIVGRRKDKNSSEEKFKQRFPTFSYDKFKDCLKFLKNNKIDALYDQKQGVKDDISVPFAKNYVHAVFQCKRPHGDSYQYISEWLAKKMGMPGCYVPYIVNMPEPEESIRKKLGISDQQIVVGWIGGRTQFSIDYAKRVVEDVAKERKDIVFVLMNSLRFAKHKRIIYLDPTFDEVEKSNFISSCDYMLHARNRGETFGMAIAEFLYHDKPVIASTCGVDQNHRYMMGDKGIWYHDEDSLKNVFASLFKSDKPACYYSDIVKKYSPDEVMQRFNNLFISS